MTVSMEEIFVVAFCFVSLLFCGVEDVIVTLTMCSTSTETSVSTDLNILFADIIV
jgi:hypothetical protein